MVVLNAVRDAPQGGLFMDPGSSNSGYTFGNIEPGTAKIATKYLSNSPLRAWVNGQVGLHEVAHVGIKDAGRGYTHTEMAQAAYDVAQAMGINIKDLGQRPANNTALDPKEWTKMDNAASTHFNNRLFDACKGNPTK